MVGILAAEAAAAVTAHAAVGVHDDLAPGQAGVAHRPADHEPSGGVDVVLGVGVQHVRRDHGLDHVLQHFRPQLLVVHQLGVLGGDDHGVHAHRAMVLVVFHCDLGLAVGPQLVELAALADLGEAHGEPVRQGDGHGHQHFGVSFEA